MIRHQRSQFRQGFTLVELVVTMLILSILAVVVVLRFDSKSKIAAAIEAELLQRNLAHVQNLAMSSAVALRLTVAASGKSYFVTCLTVSAASPCKVAGQIPSDPATGEPFSITLADGVNLVASKPPGTVSNTLDFDSVGRPFEAGNLIATNPARTFTFTGASRLASVLVRPVTGFAEVSATGSP